MRAMQAHHDLMLIDIRRKSDFDRVRIPGSINIPLFAVKTKTFLISKRLALISEGYGYSELERECRKLRESGFTVSILTGGLQCWRYYGGPLIGNPFALNKLNKMCPAVFDTEKDSRNWIIVDVSATKRSVIGRYVPHAPYIPYRDNNDRFISAFEERMASFKTDRFTSIVLCDETGERYDRIEKVIQKLGFDKVFYLQGGIEAYVKWKKDQAITERVKHSRTKTLKKCINCF